MLCEAQPWVVACATPEDFGLGGTEETVKDWGDQIFAKVTHKIVRWNISTTRQIEFFSTNQTPPDDISIRPMT